MKFLVLALAAISTVSASKAVTCDECQAAVTDLAGCIYNHFMLEQDVCGELLGLCYKKSQKVQLMERVSDWTCEECTDILARTADYMSRDETIAEGVAYLQGERLDL